MHLPVSPMYTLPHSQGILYTTLLVFVEAMSTKYDLRVASNMKTDRTPCCYRQRRSGWDKRLMYGRTAVDLISLAGSLSNACRFLDFVMLVTNQ